MTTPQALFMSENPDDSEREEQPAFGTPAAADDPEKTQTPADEQATATATPGNETADDDISPESRKTMQKLLDAGHAHRLDDADSGDADANADTDTDDETNHIPGDEVFNKSPGSHATSGPTPNDPDADADPDAEAETDRETEASDTTADADIDDYAGDARADATNGDEGEGGGLSKAERALEEMERRRQEGSTSKEDAFDSDDEEDTGPPVTSQELGVTGNGDGDTPDLSGLKETKEHIATVRGIEFTLRDPDDYEALTNDLRDLDDPQDTAAQRWIAVKHAVVDDWFSRAEWDDFVPSVKYELGNKALAFLGLFDFSTRPSGGPNPQEQNR